MPPQPFTPIDGLYTLRAPTFKTLEGGAPQPDDRAVYVHRGRLVALERGSGVTAGLWTLYTVGGGELLVREDENLTQMWADAVRDERDCRELAERSTKALELTAELTKAIEQHWSRNAQQSAEASAEIKRVAEFFAARFLQLEERVLALERNTHGDGR